MTIFQLASLFIIAKTIPKMDVYTLTFFSLIKRNKICLGDCMKITGELCHTEALYNLFQTEQPTSGDTSEYHPITAHSDDSTNDN